MKIDHFAVSGMKLEEATEYVESTLGYKMEKGVSINYLELITIYLV